MYEIDLAFQGPEFVLALHTASILVVIFTCFMYAGGIPILNLFCFFAILILYWVDKYLVLNHYRLPPRFSQLFNDRILVILPFAVIIHSLISMWMYGSEHIFPTDFKDDKTEKTDEDYVVADRHNLGKRMSSDAGILFIITTLIAIGLIFLN